MHDKKLLSTQNNREKVNTGSRDVYQIIPSMKLYKIAKDNYSKSLLEKLARKTNHLSTLQNVVLMSFAHESEHDFKGCLYRNFPYIHSIIKPIDIRSIANTPVMARDGIFPFYLKVPMTASCTEQTG